MVCLPVHSMQSRQVPPTGPKSPEVSDTLERSRPTGDGTFWQSLLLLRGSTVAIIRSIEFTHRADAGIPHASSGFASMRFTPRIRKCFAHRRPIQLQYGPIFHHGHIRQSPHCDREREHPVGLGQALLNHFDDDGVRDDRTPVAILQSRSMAG